MAIHWCRITVAAAAVLSLLACDPETGPGAAAGSDAAASHGEPDAAHPPVGDGGDGPSGDDAALDAGITAPDAAPDGSGSAAADGSTEDAALDASLGPDDSAVQDAATTDGSVEDGAVDAGQVDGGDHVDPEPLPSGDHVMLPFRLVDAEYNRAIDRIVIVSAGPARAIVLDPEVGTFQELELPLPPSSVSVHPNGSSAAIGHNGYVSVIDLEALDLLETWPVSIDVADVVLAGDQRVYAFPNANGDAMHAVNVTTGEETQHGRLTTFTVGRLHPAGDRIYGAERNVSPSDLLRFGIGSPYSYDSPYHGEYNTGRNLWLSDDGARIFGAGGDTFRASDAGASADMTYYGSLHDRPYVEGLDHSSAAGLVAITSFPRPPSEPALLAHSLSAYEDELLDLRQTVALPHLTGPVGERIQHGRFTFFRSDGARLYVLADSGSIIMPAVQSSSAVIRYSIDPEAEQPIIIDDPPIGPPSRVATPSAGTMLDYDVVDAEHHDDLDRIVLITSGPDRLITLDPSSGEAEEVRLPLDPSAVSIHPDGATAAVGHDALVSLIELDPPQLVDMLPVSADLADVVLASNGYVYGTPASPSDWRDLHSLHVGTGEETSSYGSGRDTVIRLHSAGDRLYATTRGISPGDIERYDISLGRAIRSYDSPYHGDYDMGFDFWLSDDGARIFAASGSIFRTADVRMGDIAYEAALEGDVLAQYLDHSSAAGSIAVVTRYGSELLIYDDALFQLQDARPLPTVTVSGRSYATTGRFVFFSTDGSTIHVIARAEGAPIAHTDLLITFQLAPAAP